MSFYKCSATSYDDIEHNLYIDLNCSKVEGPNTLDIHLDGADGICIKCVTALKVTSVVCGLGDCKCFYSSMEWDIVPCLFINLKACITHVNFKEWILHKYYDLSIQSHHDYMIVVGDIVCCHGTGSKLLRLNIRFR